MSALELWCSVIEKGCEGCKDYMTASSWSVQQQDLRSVKKSCSNTEVSGGSRNTEQICKRAFAVILHLHRQLLFESHLFKPLILPRPMLKSQSIFQSHSHVLMRNSKATLPGARNVQKARHRWVRSLSDAQRNHPSNVSQKRLQVRSHRHPRRSSQRKIHRAQSYPHTSEILPRLSRRQLSRERKPRNYFARGRFGDL